MEKKSQVPYFSDKTLARFVAAEGNTVQKVVCHLWLNALKKDAPVEVIDNVELHFGGDQKLTIGCDLDTEGLDAVEFDFATATRQLKEDFGDKIRLFAIDASPTKMWQGVIGKKLNAVRVTKEDGRYRADAIVLDFGEEKREISTGPLDGLVIDFWEQ